MSSESDWSHVNAVVYAESLKSMDDVCIRCQREPALKKFSITSQAYTKFASVYDVNMASLESVGNQNMIRVAYEYVKSDESSVMLDVAAGTGWTAHYFREAGFKGQIDGIEMNPAMLDQAIAKGLYRKTFCMEVKENEPLPVQNDSYDVATAAGAFLHSHLPSGCIWYLVNALKSGGHLVFNSRRTPQNEEYQTILFGYLNQMVKDKKIELLKKEETLFYGKNCKESGKPMMAFAFVYKKL